MKITSIDKDGVVHTRSYNNRTCKFTENDQQLKIQVTKEFFYSRANNNKPVTNNGGQHVTNNGGNQRPQPKYKTNEEATQEYKEKYFGRVTGQTKSPNPSTLKIQLGLGCNFSCSYCKQAIHASEAEATSMTDLNNFIATFDDWCTAPRDEPIRIELWGGEPLVYIAKIKKLVEFLESRFDYPSFGMVSNGSLMTKKTADYLLEHNISLTISWDGPWTTEHRDSDPLAPGSESLEAIKYYASKSRSGVYLNAVMTKHHIDPKQLYIGAKELMGDVRFQVGYEGMADIESEEQCADTDNLFSEDDYRTLRETVKSQLLAGELDNVMPYNMKFNNLVASWCNDNEMVFDNSFQKCGMDNPHTLAVNLRGEALVCHSSDDVIGHVSDFATVTLANSKVGHFSNKEECRSCPVLNLCRGSCMNLRGNEWYYTCNNEFHYNMGIFEAAFETIFGEQILAIEDVVRPVKEETKKVFKIKAI